MSEDRPTPETDAFAEQFPLNEPHPIALTGLARRLERERDEAREWKDSAMKVLSEWEAAWIAAGSPGKLGESKAVAMRDHAEKFRKALADAIRRPMGIVPESAEEFLRPGDLEAAEERRVDFS